MAAIYLAPFYLLVCVYILLRSLHWFQVLHTVFQNVWVKSISVGNDILQIYCKSFTLYIFSNDKKFRTNFYDLLQ